MNKTLFTALLLTTIYIPANISGASIPPQPTTRIAQADLTDGTLTPHEVQQTAKNITVRVTSTNNGGSGVIIAQKGNNYLILTNAHVVRRATKIEIQAPDGQKYQAKTIDGGFDSKYDLALLQFTSKTKYTLANLSSISGSPLTPERIIYSAGFPFDSKDIRITSGQVSQLSDIPFDDGTQIGYVTDKGKQGIRQGMSGGAIFDAQGNLLGINTVGVAPILPDYTYNDGSKPLAKLKAQYAHANWGIPVYNFLTNVKPDILYGYANLPKVERQVTPTGYLAKLNIKARQMTVRIENSGGNGSGVIVAKEGNSYYVLTAKHVLQNPDTSQKYTNHQIITYDQDQRGVTSSVVAEGVDLAVVKFESNNKYPIAQLGEYSQNDNDIVFVGGFPGREKINSPLWQWQLNPGFVKDREQGKLQTQTNQSFSNGYALIYGSISYGGMSGGPVFDSSGNVIGIHGRAESTDLNSLGISIQTFTGLLDKLRVNPSLLKFVKTNPVDLNQQDRQNVIAEMQNIPRPQVEDNGERWLAYGNQLYRTRQSDKAIVAFDRAITRDQKLQGSYGKALSLWSIGKYQLAESAISQAIAAIPSDQASKYYYIWKYKSVILQASEKYDEALKAINIAITLGSNDLTLLNQKASILASQKLYSAAIDIYSEIINKQPEAYAYNNRGLAKSDLGNKQEAISDYNQAITLSPNHINAYNNRGNAKSDLGNKQEAISDYNRVIALNPKDDSAYYNRGNARFSLGNKQEAISDYNRAIALNPQYSEAYTNRGVTKSDLGNKQGAISDYDRAIVLNPENYEAYTNRGNTKSDLGNKQGAISDYDRAIVLNSKYDKAYYNRGNFKLALGNKQAAIIDYDRAIALNPKFVDAYINRGIAKSNLGNEQEGIADYDRAIALNPKYANTYYNRGKSKLALGNKQAAIIDYDRAIALNPKYVEAYSDRGVAKSDLGNKQAAISDYNRAIALNPKYAPSYNNRGIAKSELGDKQGGIADISKAAELFRQQGRMDLYQKGIGLLKRTQSPIAQVKNSAQAYFEQGNAKYSLGDNQGAIIDYDQAIALDSKYVNAYYNRGNAKSALGREQEAIIDFNSAIALNSKFTDAYFSRGLAKSILKNNQEAIIDYSQVISLDY
jgi:tetratricopeptide (TPR) repeat protein/S1-C subfamily serine protease